MRLRLVNLLVTAALVLPMAAQAETFSYRYVDAAHLPDAEIDSGSVDVNGDGMQLRGSLPFYQNFFVLAELQDLNLDNGVDSTRIMIGAGGHWPINGMLDIVARAGVVDYEVEAGSFDDDDTGLFIGARVRAIVAPKLELEGGIEHLSVEVAGLDNDTYLVGEGRYNFTPQWSAGVLLTLGGDTSIFGVHGRYSF